MNPSIHLSISIAALPRGCSKLVTVSLLCSCMFLTSCGTGQQFSGPSAQETGHWYRARSSPPTFYPKGTRADQPTDLRDGSWVYAGDPAGTRYFIPVKGAGGKSAQQLVDEALAAMHPSKKARLKEELKDADKTDAAGTTVEAAALILYFLASGLAGAGC